MTQHTWQKWVGTVCGTGYLPIAPGTWGTAAGILVLLPFYGCSGGQMLYGLIIATGPGAIYDSVELSTSFI